MSKLQKLLLKEYLLIHPLDQQIVTLEAGITESVVVGIYQEICVLNEFDLTLS